MLKPRPLSSRAFLALPFFFFFGALILSPACSPNEPSSSVFGDRNDALAAKNVPWLHAAGDDSGASSMVHSATDTDHAIYVTGVFSGASEFPGIGLVSSAGDRDLFVGKIDPGNGSFVWFFKGGSTLRDHGNRIAVDADGVYVTGTLRGNGTFGTASYTCSNTCSFLAKLEKTSGAITWFKLFTGTGTSGGTSLFPLGSHLYAVGQFTAIATYESTSVQSGYDIAPPNSASKPFTTTITADAYFLKLNKTDGSLVWLRRAGGNLNDAATDVYADSNYVYVVGSFTRKARFERRNPLAPVLGESGNYLTIETPTSTHPTSAVRLFFAKFSPSTGNIVSAIHGGGGTYAQPAAASCTSDSDCTLQTLCNTSLGQCYVPSFEHTFVYGMAPHRSTSNYFYVAVAFVGNVTYGSVSLSTGALTNRNGALLRIRNVGDGVFDLASHFSSPALDSVEGVTYFSDPANNNRDRVFVSGRRTGSGDYDAFVARIIPSTLAINKIFTFGTAGKDSAGTVAAAKYNASDPNSDFLFFGGAFQGPLTIGTNSVPFSGSPEEDAFWSKINRPLCGYSFNDPC